jgi:hypothetical protein
MAKQPEQILEKLISFRKVDHFDLEISDSIKVLKINCFKDLTKYIYTVYIKYSIFVSTVPAMHTVRSASGSFFLYGYGK